MFKKITSLILFALLVFTSCEIGLGDSIDIERPTVDITYPPQNAIIRDSFILAGNCHDDMEVRSVSVSIRNTTLNKFYGTYDAEVVNGATWSLELNQKIGEGNGFLPAKYRLDDGTYEITVTVEDGDKKTETAKTSFDIDNTPPVFIVQSPGSVDNAEKYGAVFAINGQTYDDHTVGMKVQFYKDSAYISGGDFNSAQITTSGNTEIARYRKEGSSSDVPVTDKNLEYSKLNEAGANRCAITIYDNAKIYKNPGDSGVAGGNATSKLFLYDSVHSEYLSKTGMGLTLANFMHILNKTEKIGDLEGKLISKLVDSTSNPLAISLDPVSPPTYSLTEGYKLFDGDGTVSESLIQAFTGGQINAAVNAGPDGTGITKSSLKMWIKAFSRENAKTEIKTFLGKVSAEKTLESKETFLNENATMVYDGTSDTSNSAASVSITGDLGKVTISGGQVYLVLVTGKDEDGILVDAASADYYGFEGLATGTSPVITIITPNNRIITGVPGEGNSIQFTGTATAGDDDLDRIKVVESIYEISTPDTKFTNEIERITDFVLQDDKKAGSWTFTPSDNAKAKLKEKKGDYIYTVKFVVYDAGGKTSYAEREIEIDYEAPVLELKSLSQIAKEERVTDSGNEKIVLKVNGTINVIGSVTEQNLVSTGWEVIKGASGVEALDKKENTNASSILNETFDTTKYFGATRDTPVEFDIQFWALDKGGNRTEKKLSDYLKEAYNPGNPTTIIPVELVIDQSTDKPVIEVQNADTAIDAATKLGENKNIFARESTLFIRITDDDGVNKVTVDCTGIPTQNFTDVKTGSVNYSLPAADGKYKITITAEDISGVTNSVSFWVAVSGETVTCDLAMNLVSSTGPAFSSGEYVKGQTIFVNGTIHSTHKVKKVFLAGSEDTLVQGGDEDNINLTTFTHEITPSGNDGDRNTVTYKIVNEFGQTSYVAFDYIVDITSPVLDRNTPLKVNGVTPGTSVWYNSQDLTLEGVFTDAGSGITEVKYVITRPNISEPLTGTITATRISGTNNYKFYGTVSGFEEGINSLKVYAVDTVGNTSDETGYAINVDTTEPVISAAKDTYITNGSTISISGTYSDAKTGDISGRIPVSGVDEIQIVVGSKTYSSKDESPKVTLKDGKWTLTEADCSGISGTVILKAIVKDKAGNRNSYNIGSLVVDKTPPSVFIDSILPISSDNVTDCFVTIKGRASDTNAFDLADNTNKKLLLAYISGEEDWSDTSATPIKQFDVADFYNWEVNHNFSSISERTKITLGIICTDCAGNTTRKLQVITVDPKADYPEINLLNIGGNGSSSYAMSSRMISGTISDDDGAVKGLWFTTDSSLLSGENPSLPTVANSNGWTPINISNGSWTLTDAAELKDLEDGNYSLYFYCIDANGTAFNSNSGQIAFSFQGQNKDYKKHVDISFDTSAPEVDSVELLRSATASLTASEMQGAVWKNNLDYAGGEQKYLYAKVVVTANAISKMIFNDGYTDTDLSGKTITSEKNYIWKKSDGDVIKTSDEYRDLGATEKNHYKEHITYYFGPFDLGDAIKYSGIKTLRFTAQGAKYNGSEDVNLYVDNTAPTILITYPTEEVDGKTSVNVVANDSAGSGPAKIEYMIPTKTEQAAEVSDLTGWKLVSTSSTGEIKFESDSVTKPVDGKESLAAYSNDTYATGKNGIWKVPVYFRLTDNLGNVGYATDLSVKYNLDSGIPSCEITYPAENEIISGVITVAGKTICKNEIKEIQVQLDVNNDGKYDLADYNIISEWKNPGFDECVFAGQLEKAGTADWYLKLNGGTSWNFTLNTTFLKESKPTEIRIRAQALNNDGDSKGYAERTVQINWDKPTVKNLKLVQKDDSGNVLVSQDYKAGMYIGKPLAGCNWYLNGICEDTNSTTKLDSFALNNTGSAGTFDTSKNKDNGLNTDSFEFSLKLTTSGATASGLLGATITISNNAPDSTTSQDINIYLDQTAPSIMPRLKAFGTDINEANAVQNSNGIFSFSGEIAENESGLDYVAFYFQRNSGSVTKIYDPMMNYKENSAAASSLTQITQGDTEKYINSENFPVISVSDGTRGADTFTSAALSKYCASYSGEQITSKNVIRKGGLIKIGGVYRLIKNVNKATGTITFSPEADTSYTSAEIVLAQIVDNQVRESASHSGSAFDYETVLNDDGDGMIENLSPSGAWSASIQSSNIPDGPVEIHVVAIDKAGNTSHSKVQTAVQNSRPRLAKVFIGTDLDGNGKFDFKAASQVVNSTTSTEGNTISGTEYGEFMYYSCLNSQSREAQSNITLDSNTFVIKNRLAIIPDFVGGNESIHYAYNIADSETNLKDGSNEYLSKANFILRDMKAKSGYEDQINTPDSTSKSILEGYISQFGYIVVENTDEPTAATGKNLSDLSDKSKLRHFAFTFWDATEETTPGTDSQWALLKFQATINTVDKEAPRTRVNPFYWNSLHDNSIYGSAKSDVMMTSDLQGHIELEEDWKLAPGFRNGDSTGIYDGDPKVSGKVVIKGSAFDDVRLKNLWINFGDSSLSSSGGTKQFDGKTFYKAATYNSVSGVWETAGATMERDKWSFEVISDRASGEDVFFTQSGHQVVWKFSIDSEIVENMSKADVEFKILAEDDSSAAGGLNCSKDNNHAENKNTYRMDVVPYVTNITTLLSSRNPSNPSVYNRTAQGHYPVRGDKNEKAAKSDNGFGETIVINGFNFGTTCTVKALNAGGNGVNQSGTIMANGSEIHVNVGAIRSGELSVVSAGGIENLNNLNRNDIESNNLNNGRNNNNLNDDIILDVWEFKNIAEQSSSELSNPTVRFNPVNGMLGASFSSNEYFNMPGRQNKVLYSQYPYMKGQGGCDDNTFTYDKNGYTYGAAQFQYNNGDSVGGYFRFAFGTATAYTSLSPYDAFRGRVGTSDLESNTVNLRKYPTATAAEWASYPYRIVSPQIVADPLDSTSQAVMVHIAYVDTATNQIRYRRSIVSPKIDETRSAPTTTAFNPNAAEKYITSVPGKYEIIALPVGYVEAGKTKYKVGDVITAKPSETGYTFVTGEHYIRYDYAEFLKGSSLRSVNDFDADYMINTFDLTEVASSSETTGEDVVFTTRYPDYYYSVDLKNGKINQTVTAYTNSTGNKPGYPYYKYTNGSINSSSGYTYPFYAPDSLQNLAGQTIHVIASSGKNLAGGEEIMEIYQKSSAASTDLNGNTIPPHTYANNAGKSVALGVGQNHYPVIAWHDSEENKLKITYNTSSNKSGKAVYLSETDAGLGELELAEKQTYNSKGTNFQKSNAVGERAFYAVYPYMTNYSNSLTMSYYILTDETISEEKFAGEIEGFVEDTTYNTSGTKFTGNPNGLKSIGINSTSGYIINKLDLYTSPKNMRYKVLKAEYGGNTYYLYNSNNYIGSGQLLEKKVVAGKTIFVPINKTYTRNANEVINFLVPEDGTTYGCADGSNVYASFPMYEFKFDRSEYMGTAVENTINSFDRTAVWEGHTSTLAEGGQDVQMVVMKKSDGVDVIHLAYYDENSGSLKYTTVEFTDSGFQHQGEIVTVDSDGDIGEKLTLDVVVDDNGNHIPYIGYYGNKRAKLAYLINPQEVTGIENGHYKGNWEVTYVPGERGISKDNINVAMRKDANGKAIAGTGAADSVSSYYSTVYSNATTNPVMGYINSVGNLELAQRR